MEIPYNTIIDHKCLWIKDSNGVELSCGFVFKHNNNEYLIKYHKKRKEYIAVRLKRSESGLINWRDESWIKRVAKYCFVTGYVMDPKNQPLINRCKEYLSNELLEELQ